MKKLMFILAVVLVVVLGTMTNAHADSLGVHLIGNDNLTPAYGLSYSVGDRETYASLEAQTTRNSRQNTALLSGGLQLGPINFGPVVGTRIESSSGSVSGLAGAELGLKADIAGPLFVKENNRVLRGAGGTSSGQVDLGLGINF
jgi:hypothetical protein